MDHLLKIAASLDARNPQYLNGLSKVVFEGFDYQGSVFLPRSCFDDFVF